MKIRERVILQNILPKKWSYTDMSIISEINDKARLSQDEIKDMWVTESSDGSITWAKEKDKWVKITFSKAETNIIRRTLKDLDSKKEITSDMMTLYDMFG